jgi:multidrug efflux pump subunit AcrA (membrane-fusion protein)
MNKFTEWRPSRRWLLWPPVLVGVVAIVMFMRGEKELVRVEASEQATPTQVVKAEKRRFAATAIGYGTAVPARTWTSLAEVSGTIKKIHPKLESGNRVEAGELLVEIDDRDYQLRVAQREADLDSARAKADELSENEKADRVSLGIEEELLLVANTELKRIDRLRETNAASRSEQDTAQSDLLRQTQSVQSLRNVLAILPTRIAAARAAVSTAEARLEEARRELARTKIVAPFGGRLSGVTIEPDQVISQATRLFDLLDVDTIQIEAKFSPSQILQMLRVFRSDPTSPVESTLANTIGSGSFDAHVTLRSGRSELQWPATPLRLAESVDPVTRTLGIIVAVDNSAAIPAAGESEVADTAEAGLPGGDLKETYGLEFSGANRVMRLHPGLYCEVKLTSVSLQESILIPATAVDGDFVYVVTAENRMQRREVAVTYSVDQDVVISVGLDEGELVVLRPPVPAIDGMLVDPILVDDAVEDSAISLTADGHP